MDQQDLFQQKNKKFTGIREKLKKKRERKEQIKKQKKLKNKGQTKKIYKKKNKKDKDGIKEKKLRKHLQKLLILFNDDLKDFYNLFQNFDNGGNIDISQLENQGIKNCLAKIFKYLKPFLNVTNQEYSKKKEFQDMNLEKFIQRQIQFIFDKLESSSDSKSQSNQESIQEESYSQQEDSDQSQIEKSEDEQPQVDQPQDQQINNQQIVQNVQQKKTLGPQFIKPEEREKFIEQCTQKIEREEWMRDEGIDNFLSNTFGELEQKTKLKDFLDKRQKGPQNQVIQVDKTEELQIKNYIEEYDKRFRPQSLMEIHKEKMKNKPKNSRKAFDRDRDMDLGRIDSKKLFKTINDKQFSLSSKFGDSRFEKSFL